MILHAIIRSDRCRPLDICWVPQKTWEPRMSDRTIRERLLTSLRPSGGAIVGVRIVEASDGTWSMYVKLSWKVGEHLVAVYRSAQPKRYKSLSAAVAHCRAAYQYRGSIILETEIQEPLPHDEPPSHH
jgi:hypothetical protein